MALRFVVPAGAASEGALAGKRHPAGCATMRPVSAPVMSADETLKYMLDKAQRRTGTPVRRSFVQGGTRHDPKPGPLSAFVSSHDRYGLDLFLLTLTLATKEPYHVIYAAGWWARAIGVSDETRISKAWKRLEDRKLVAREREGRVVVVMPLLDDGSGRPYKRPALKGESYGRLSPAYWEDGYFKDLKLPGKAMLLVALAQPGMFTLPSERAKQWYGMSADFVEDGFAELRHKRILARGRDWRLNRKVGGGFAPANVYQLLPPFSKAKGVVPITRVK